jgi:hypothetical protein
VRRLAEAGLATVFTVHELRLAKLLGLTIGPNP